MRESLFKIDPIKIDTIDLTNDYVPIYRKEAIEILKERKALEKEITTYEAEIAQYEELNSLVK